MNNIQSTDKQFVANTYNRFPVTIVSGKGSEVYDDSGKRYIDMGSGIGVTAMGIADDAWVAAVTAQLGKVQHMSNLYYTEPCAKLAEMLCTRTGMSKVFFANSGAEANECAIKVARKYAADKKGEDCYTIVTLEKSFHGRTLTTLAATGQDHFHKLFQPLTPGFVHTPANDFEAFKTTVETVGADKVAGIMLECVQGEGGVIALDKDFVAEPFVDIPCDMPWEDDDTLRIVLFHGRELLQAIPEETANKIREIPFVYNGPALNISSALNVRCNNCDIEGDVSACGNVYCSEVGGHSGQKSH